MKLLILSHMYPRPQAPIFGLFVHDQVKQLARHADVLVVSPTPWVPPGLDRLQAKWAAYAATPPQLTLEGVTVHYPRYLNLPGQRGFAPSAFLYGAAVTRYVTRLRSHFDFELIHAHAVVPDGFAAAKIGRRWQVPVICTIHGAEVNVYPDRTWLTHWVTRQAIGAVDQLVAVSAALKRQTLRLACPQREIEVIPNGVDLQQFNLRDKQQLRAELGLPLNVPILLYASRLDPAKGLSYLLAAFKALLAGCPHCLLVLLGDGPYRGHLVQEIEALGLQSNVTLAGPRPHAEIARWMSAADLVVQPSLHEGSPLPVYEALACGRPLIATQVGGIPELITSEAYGLLVPPADVAALSAALRRGVQTAWDAAHIRRYGQQFAWEQMAGRLMTLYRHMLAGQIEWISNKAEGVL